MTNHAQEQRGLYRVKCRQILSPNLAGGTVHGAVKLVASAYNFLVKERGNECQ